MIVEFLQLLLLIIIANGAPILIRVLLNDSFKHAVDFGQTLPDGRRIFGPSKTWRGIFAALLVTSLVAWLMGLAPQTGFLVAVYAITGDLISSFIKRRLDMEASSMALFLDQVPESLLPALLQRHVFNLDISAVLLLVLIFIIVELLLSHILYKWGVRNTPY